MGNSTFILQFYDYRFPNKLYANRRRFMTQYVERFPLPDPSTELGKTIIEKAKEMSFLEGTKDSHRQVNELNHLVWEAFGLPFEETAR